MEDQQAEENITFNTRSIKPVISQTAVFRDENSNLVISEEHMHKLFDSFTSKGVA